MPILFFALMAATVIDMLLKARLFQLLELEHRELWLELGAPTTFAFRTRAKVMSGFAARNRFIWGSHGLHVTDPAIGRLVRWLRPIEAMALLLFVVGVLRIVLYGQGPA